MYEELKAAQVRDRAMPSGTSSDKSEPQASGTELPIRSEVKDSEGSQRVDPNDSQKVKTNKSQKKKSSSAHESPSAPESKGPDTSSAGISRLPDFVAERNDHFSELKRKHDAEVLTKDHPVIQVVLDLGFDKNGSPRPEMPVAAKAWESTPGSFLKHVDKEISSDVVVAKVDGKELWDLDRPLERDGRVSYIPFSSAEGRNVFWHSSAHVLGEAAECHYGCLLSHGPPVEQGFFYDMAIEGG